MLAQRFGNIGQFRANNAHFGKHAIASQASRPLVCFGAAAIIVARVVIDLNQPDQLIPAAVSLLFGLVFLRATDVTFDKIG